MYFMYISHQTSSTETVIVPKTQDKQPISIEAGNSEYKHKNSKINEKIK